MKRATLGPRYHRARLAINGRELWTERALIWAVMLYAYSPAQVHVCADRVCFN